MYGDYPPSSAIHEGDFKLIEFFEDGGRRELYNLRTDPGEQHDLATALPEKAVALYRILQAWQADIGATIPEQANPNYDPRAERPRGGPGRGGRRNGVAR